MFTKYHKELLNSKLFLRAFVCTSCSLWLKILKIQCKPHASAPGNAEVEAICRGTVH